MSKKVNSKEFTNSIGNKFILQGLPPLTMPSLMESISFPNKPTYSITTATGEIETHEHDETTLQTPEDYDAWSKYEEDKQKAEQELSNRMLNCILIEGVTLPEGIDFTRWEKRQKLMGLSIPEDEEEKLLQYKKNEVIRSADDIRELMRLVMELTGVTQEVVELTKKSFPD